MRVASEGQRNEEWFRARLGKLTASRSGSVIAKLKRKEGEAAERFNYKAQVVAERLTGSVTQAFRSIWMEAGNDYEDKGREACELALNTFVDQTGLILHPRYDYFGASPDGLLPGNGVLEIKVPAPANHLKYLLGHLDPREEYGAQMLGEIICCEADYCVFASFNPDFPSHLKLFTKRYERGDMGAIDAYEHEIEKFNAEVEAMVEQLKEEAVAA